ncbi:hypothetical protein [Nocardia sp. NBC_00511]|uniref:hypothetical protein n=1 Tax=Nocardia sp. NBC_00511 TaxID=2903591 RepID=UPI0030E24824
MSGNSCAPTAISAFGTVDFTLDTGKRTRADIADPADPARLFTGSWAYDPVNPAYLNNLNSMTVATGPSTRRATPPNSRLRTRSATPPTVM